MTITKGQPDRGTALMAGEERRRSQRVIIRIAVTLELTGQQSVLHAHTVAVNVHGAMVLSSTPLDLGTKVTIVNDRTQERASARVTRASRESAEGYLIPVEFAFALPEFWQISFPPSNWKPSDS